MSVFLQVKPGILSSSATSCAMSGNALPRIWWKKVCVQQKNRTSCYLTWLPIHWPTIASNRSWSRRCRMRCWAAGPMTHTVWTAASSLLSIWLTRLTCWKMPLPRCLMMTTKWQWNVYESCLTWIWMWKAWRKEQMKWCGQCSQPWQSDTPFFLFLAHLHNLMWVLLLPPSFLLPPPPLVILRLPFVVDRMSETRFSPTSPRFSSYSWNGRFCCLFDSLARYFGLIGKAFHLVGCRDLVS